MGSRRVSFEQLEILWDFLNNHKDVAMGYNKSAQARSTSRRLWTEVAQALNSVVGGAIKDFKGWAAYWIDYKGKLKRKCAAIRTSQTRTGGGPAETLSLTDIERKYLSILGEDYGMGLPGIQIDPFDTVITTPPLLSDSPLSQSILAVPGTSRAIEEYVDTGLPLLGMETPTIEEHIHNVQQPIEQAAREPSPVQPRRVRRRPAPMSQEAARRALVEHSRKNVEAAQEHNTIGRERNRIAQEQNEILRELLILLQNR